MLMHLLSLLIGSVVGSLYGIAFVTQQTRSLASDASTTRKPRSFMLRMGACAAARILLLMLTWYVLLRTPLIRPILVAISCIVAFWAVVWKAKACSHERDPRF